MIKNVLTSLFSVFLFALGAAGSWYFVQWQTQQKDAQEHGDELPSDMTTVEASTKTHGSSKPAAEAAHGHSKDEHPKPVSDPLPFPVRGATMSAEQIVRTASMYQQQVENLKRREADVETQEARLHLAQKDLDQRKLEIEGTLQQVQNYIERGDQMLAQIRTETESLQGEKELRRKEIESLQGEKEQRRKELESIQNDREQRQKELDAIQNERLQREKDEEGQKQAKILPSEDRAQNLKRMAALMSGMNEDKAAEVIKQMANNGETSFALEILDQIDERDASKIMDALAEDTTLVTQLMEALRDLKRDSPPIKKR